MAIRLLSNIFKSSSSTFKTSKAPEKVCFGRSNQRHIASSTISYEKTRENYTVELNSDTESLTLSKNREILKFPFVWLRDNCQCPQCFHATSKSRIINWENFDINAKADKCELQSEGKTIGISWSDGHSSEYSLEWLRERSFLKENRRRYYDSTHRVKRIEWDKNYFESVLKRFDYGELLASDSHLKDWLEALSAYGVALIERAKPSTDSCRRLASRVDFIKRTHYGEEFFVQDKPDTTNEAYRSGDLQMHTDLPYYEHGAGVILLHYLTQSINGGQNLLCDGLHIANELKKSHPAHYDVLASTPVDWEDFGAEEGNRFHSLIQLPVICEDLRGRIIRINCSTTQRASHFDVDLERVRPWYEAYRAFVNMAYERAAVFKVSEGCMLAFDNTRMVHGRIGYRDTKKNVRCLVGVYLDWDYVNSRIRILNET